MTRAKLEGRRRCPSRAEAKDGKIVQCNKKPTFPHGDKAAPHTNERPGREFSWTDDEALASNPEGE